MGQTTTSYIQDKFDKMLKLQSRLGDWEVIQPGRELLKEGELVKISRKREDIRYLILLTDCACCTHLILATSPCHQLA